MRLTIIPSDGNVGVDNYFFSNLDLFSCDIPNNIHALQWYEIEGELEFIDNPDRTKPQNQIITELPVWAIACVSKWNEAKAKQEADILLLQATTSGQPVTTGTQSA